MRFTDWIVQYRNISKTSQVRRSASRRRRYRQATNIESLESRRLLTAGTVTVNSGTYTIDLASTAHDVLIDGQTRVIVSTKSISNGEEIITKETLSFTLNGVANTKTISAAANIIINGNSNDNLFDLHNVTPSRFGSLNGVTLNGLGGNDSIGASFFDDTIHGGDGDDLIEGIHGDDVIFGGTGADTLDGGTGVDVLDGGPDGGTDTDVDTIYTVTGLENAGVTRIDSVTNSSGDTIFNVELPSHKGSTIDPSTGLSITRINGKFNDAINVENQRPEIVTDTMSDYAEVLPWGAAVYNRHWANPAYSIDGKYIKLENKKIGIAPDPNDPDATPDPQGVANTQNYDIIIDATTYDPLLIYRPQFGNFRWSQNPNTPSRFYDATDSTIIVGDVANGSGNQFESYNIGLNIALSKGGVMYGNLGDYDYNDADGLNGGEVEHEFLVAFDKPTNPKKVYILDLDAIVEGATASTPGTSGRKALVTTFDLAQFLTLEGISGTPQNDMYVSPDASFLAVDYQLTAVGSDERSLLIRLGNKPDDLADTVAPYDDGRYMWPFKFGPIPTELELVEGSERADLGFTPLKFEHPTTAIGADEAVYFVGGIHDAKTGVEISNAGSNIIHSQGSGAPTIGTLVGINTNTGNIHLLTGGNGKKGAPANHVSGTQQNGGGGFVFASFNQRAGLEYSGEVIRVALGNPGLSENERVTSITRHRTSTAEGKFQQGQQIINNSPDGSKVLFTSTWGVDLATVPNLAANGLPSLVHSFVVELPTAPTIVELDETVFVSAGQTSVTTVVATDVNFGDVLSYSLAPVDDHLEFDIDSNLGTVTLKSPQTVDPMGDNTFNVTVQVSDQIGLTDQHSFDVIIADPVFDVTRPPQGTTGALTVTDAANIPNNATLTFVTESDGEHLVLTAHNGQILDELIGPEITSIEIALAGSAGSKSEALTIVNRPTADIGMVIIGGASADTIDVSSVAPGTGGAGIFIIAGAGADTVTGSQGRDTITGNAGADRIDGQGGNDSITGGTGRDILFGGAGDDSLSGMGDNDRLNGGDGNDHLIGNAGRDTIRGDGGADLILGSVGSDTLHGGDGDDTIDAGSGGDQVYGEDGNDVLDTGSGAGTGASPDAIRGGEGDDTITGGGGTSSLFGEGGSDSISGGDGDDTISGGTGDDIVNGDGGNDIVSGGVGSNTIEGGSGADTINGQLQDAIPNSDPSDVENIVRFFVEDDLGFLTITDTDDSGTAVNAVLSVADVSGVPTWKLTESGETDPYFSAAMDGILQRASLQLGSGNDNVTITQRPSNAAQVVIRGGSGTDRIIATTVTESSAGDNGFIIFGEDDNDTVSSSELNDTIVGGPGDDRLNGIAGNDSIGGGDGNDFIQGGPDNDTLFGEGGTDELFKGSGVSFSNDDDPFPFDIDADLEAINQAPAMTELGTQTVAAGRPASPIVFEVVDPENTPLTITATAADPSLVDSITVSGTGATRSLDIVASELVGETEITIEVDDGSNVLSSTINLVVELGDEIVQRINAGGGVIAGDPNYETANGFQNGSGIPFGTGSSINMTHPSVSANDPESLFKAILYDNPGGQNLEFNIPTVSGTEYELKLFFSEIWSGAFYNGARVFDVTVDGNLVLDNYDVYATAGGGNKAVAESFVITGDGNLDIDLGHVVQNPMIAGIELRSLPESTPGGEDPEDLENNAPVMTYIANQEVSLGQSSTAVSFSVLDPENGELIITATAADPAVVSSVAVTGTGASRTVEVAPTGVLGSTSITVTIDDGEHEIFETFEVSTVRQVNVGGSAIAGFETDSVYRNATGYGFSTSSTIDISNGSVPVDTPAAVFQTEVYDVGGGLDLGFDFATEVGVQYEVKLYFAEIYSGTFYNGARVFDVSLDGTLVLDNYDVFASAGGGNRGIVETFTFTGDGNLDIDFSHVTNNPIVSAITLRRIQ